jgi:membrane-associated phospholipid phosphatase
MHYGVDALAGLATGAVVALALRRYDPPDD